MNNQPASQTLSENLKYTEGIVMDEKSPNGLITGEFLYKASENKVPGASVTDELKTFENQFSAQGMGSIPGPNARRYDGYHFRNKKERPNLTHGMVENRQDLE